MPVNKPRGALTMTARQTQGARTVVAAALRFSRHTTQGKNREVTLRSPHGHHKITSRPP